MEDLEAASERYRKVRALRDSTEYDGEREAAARTIAKLCEDHPGLVEHVERQDERKRVAEERRNRGVTRESDSGVRTGSPVSYPSAYAHGPPEGAEVVRLRPLAEGPRASYTSPTTGGWRSPWRR